MGLTVGRLSHCECPTLDNKRVLVWSHLTLAASVTLVFSAVTLSSVFWEVKPRHSLRYYLLNVHEGSPRVVTFPVSIAEKEKLQSSCQKCSYRRHSAVRGAKLRSIEEKRCKPKKNDTFDSLLNTDLQDTLRVRTNVQIFTVFIHSGTIL